MYTERSRFGRGSGLITGAITKYDVRMVLAFSTPNTEVEYAKSIVMARIIFENLFMADLSTYTRDKRQLEEFLAGDGGDEVFEVEGLEVGCVAEVTGGEFGEGRGDHAAGGGVEL